MLTTQVSDRRLFLDTARRKNAEILVVRSTTVVPEIEGNRVRMVPALALQYSIANPAMTTCITGSANPDRIREWARWGEQPLDQTLLQEVLDILKPIRLPSQGPRFGHAVACH